MKLSSEVVDQFIFLACKARMGISQFSCILWLRIKASIAEIRFTPDLALESTWPSLFSSYAIYSYIENIRSSVSDQQCTLRNVSESHKTDDHTRNWNLMIRCCILIYCCILISKQWCHTQITSRHLFSVRSGEQQLLPFLPFLSTLVASNLCTESQNCVNVEDSDFQNLFSELTTGWLYLL